MGRQSLREKQKRKGKTASMMTQERHDAVDQMNARLLRKFKRIEKSCNDMRAVNLKYYWDIGKTCEEIRDNPSAFRGKDGTSGLKLIEVALSTQARTLRKAAKFAALYDKEQLDELVSLRNEESGFQLHWGHVSFLLTLENQGKRERYARETVDKMLDPSALHDLIKKRHQRGKGHGRSHAMPKTVPAQIRQILTVCRNWVGKNDDIWNGEAESVFGNVMNLAPEEMEPDMVDQLQEIESLMQLISEKSSANMATAQRAHEFLATTIAERDAREEAEAATGQHGRSIDLDSGSSGRRSRRGSAA